MAGFSWVSYYPPVTRITGEWRFWVGITIEWTEPGFIGRGLVLSSVAIAGGNWFANASFFEPRYDPALRYQPASGILEYGAKRARSGLRCHILLAPSQQLGHPARLAGGIENFQQSCIGSLLS